MRPFAVLLAVGVTAAGGAVAATASGASCLTGRQTSVLVVYEVRGGLAGDNFVLVVRRNGRARANPGSPFPVTVFTIGCPRLRALYRALEDARFSTLARRYGRDYPSNDSPTVSVSYRGRRVSVLPLGPRPARLTRVLRLLSSLARP